MKLIKLGAGVLNQTPLDWDGNRDRIVAAIRSARERGVSILCLPELCISGYGCEDAFYSPGLHQTSFRVLLEIAAETQGILVSVGLPLLHRGGIYNVAALLSNGKVLGLAGKQNLAGEGLHYEPRWFKAWPDSVCTSYDHEGTSYPLGDLIFNCSGIRIGFEICEDAWVAQRPGGELAQQGVDILLNPSASHFAFGKHEVRKSLVQEGSRSFAVSYVYTNLVGNEAGRAIYDGDAMVATNGKILARGDRFSFSDFQMTTAIVDVDESRMQRARTSSFRPDVEIEPKSRVDCEFDFPTTPKPCVGQNRDAWEASANRKEEEFTRAIALGLFDYLRKSRSRGFVVSLSGGADSAAVATLSSLAIQMAVDEIGRDECWKKLGHIPQIQACVDVPSAIKQLLTCAYQSTRNSSTVTREAARDVAKATHAEFLELDVDSMVNDYVTLVSDAIERELTWESDDLALQNIQARVRGPSVWLLANIRNALLLATSNRSEAAVGYATMDGDTCGGLSPIAGIDKAFLRQWLGWMETAGPDRFSPLPALSSVNVQQPTAELRPLETKQTDEQDLMPYELLDAIECSAIRDKHTPLEVFLEMQAQFSYTNAQLSAWIEKFFQLWCRNQWKRERYAPSFHVDDKNLDPKTWCRFPILSGGYQRELRELREYVSNLPEH